MIPKNNKKSNGRGIRGFTMIEMAIVAVLIGVMATMAVPLFTRTLPRLKTHAEARNILNAIRIARSRAIAENTQYGVYINSTARSYLLFKDIVSPTLYMYNSGDSIISGPVIFDFNVVCTGTTFTNGTVVLLPTGAASQTGTVGVNSSSGDAPYTISVLAATGKTKIQ
jgi:prepilin-type N-terminal cleavage/methylation domain-containing protein